MIKNNFSSIDIKKTKIKTINFDFGNWLSSKTECLLFLKEVEIQDLIKIILLTINYI